MKRGRMITIAGAVLLLGLAFHERRTTTSDIIAATVVKLEDRDHNAGPVTWHISARTDAGLIALKPLHARPDLAPGDMICVSRIVRPNYPVEYRRASAKASC